MPGISGYYRKTDCELANEMLSLLTHGEKWFDGKPINHPHGFHGIVDFKSRLENDYASLNGKSVVVYGDIYSFKGQKLSKNMVEAVLSLYEKHGLNFLEYLNGSFVLSIYDDGSLVIANDRLGSKNMFYTKNSDGILYSSEAKAILAEKSIKLELNPEAIYEFFTFSFPLGNKTFFEGMELLSPASVLICQQNRIQVKKYWNFKFERKNRGKDVSDLFIDFDTIMEKAVEMRISDKEKIGIFLSGGVDSRLIAGFAKRIADRKNKELITFTFGTKDGWQEKIAGQVASELGIENRFYEIPADMIANYAKEVIYKGDGHMRIRDAHFISSLDKVSSEVDSVLAGYHCDTIFGTHLNEDILDIHCKDELEEYIFDRYEVKPVAQHLPEIFSEDFRDGYDGDVKENLVNTIMEVPFDSYGDIAHYWDIQQRGRRYMLFIPNYIRWYLGIMDPFLDNKVVEFAINLPLELKYNKKFVYMACKSLFPDLTDIPLESTGSPLSATGLSIVVRRGCRFALAKTKGGVERITSGKILFKPKEYRGYEYWLRTGSRTYVEDVLLGSFKDSTSIFDQKYVENVVHKHMKGKNNHDQLICDLINFKLIDDMFLTRCNK